ncbi:MAG TPA: hypothetical protein VN201_14070 [Roseateles sp.]|nr:hypothetical protein [Roseateles sp.]HWT55242.1 hypothetical protein [Rhodocyclaceae bacterium]
MITASTPATASLPNVNPAFMTAEECRTWLASQPLASTVQMQSQLQRQLGLLNRMPIPAGERLAILETLREQLYRTQEECQARFARRPIPLALPEQAAFDSSQATWRAFVDGYIRCLESLLAGDHAVQNKAAHIIERILSTLVDMQTDIYRSSSVPPAEHWHQLHQCISVAEELGVTSEQVKDRLRNPDLPVSIESTYAEAFLLHSASPYELSQRQMAWVVRWARRWSSKVTLHAAVTDPKSPAAPYFVALDGSTPATHKPISEGKVRVLDTAGLRRSLKKRMLGLSKGESPASLQLGDDCTQPATEQLLTRVYGRWCKDITPRKHERRPGIGNCMVHCGPENAHRVFLGGKSFQLPGVADMDKLRREREQMATLGHPVEASKLQSADMPTEAEEWKIVDESASGMRLTRSNGKARIAVGMLLTLQAAGVAKPMLASVRWAVVNNEGATEIGVQMIPGQAEPLAIGGRQPGAKTLSYERALLLPAVAALKEGSSLILPAGWFEVGRILELHDGKVHNVRLGQPLERGRDFDRVTFTEVAA